MKLFCKVINRVTFVIVPSFVVNVFTFVRAYVLAIVLILKVNNYLGTMKRIYLNITYA